MPGSGFPLFKMERMRSTVENTVEHNFSESGVHPMRLEELLDGAPSNLGCGPECRMEAWGIGRILAPADLSLPSHPQLQGIRARFDGAGGIEGEGIRLQALSTRRDRQDAKCLRRGLL
jgi:hypothetical protein